MHLSLKICTRNMQTHCFSPAEARLKKKKLPNLIINRFEDTKQGWVEEMLLTRQNAWVTPDSVSMTYEALSAGCRTGIFELSPSNSKTRVSQSLRLLCKKGYIYSKRHLMDDNNVSTRSFIPQAYVCAKEINLRIASVSRN